MIPLGGRPESARKMSSSEKIRQFKVDDCFGSEKTNDIGLTVWSSSDCGAGKNELPKGTRHLILDD